MLNNSYFDGQTQKGFLPGIAGCVEHVCLTGEALRDARKEPFLCLAIKVAVVQHEIVCTVGNHGEENFTVEVVEWSEPLRSVISAWLGAVRRRFQIRLWTGGCSEKMFGVISPPRDLLLSITYILILILTFSGPFIGEIHKLSARKLSIKVKRP